MTPDFSVLIARLADAGFEFVIVGGYAAVTHGSSQVTRDLDICGVLTEESIATLREALRDWNPRHRLTPQRLSFLTTPPPGVAVENLYLETDRGIVDILTSVLGVGDFPRLKAKAESLEFDGRRCLVMSLEDLIAAKQAMNRDKDAITAKELRAIAAKRRQGTSGY
jgi:predicted nucleotidyltransferase